MYFIIQYLLLLISIVYSIYFSYDEDIWKPFTIAIIIGVISYILKPNSGLHNLSFITWGLFGYINAQLFIHTLNLSASIITALLVSLSFWVDNKYNKKETIEVIVGRIMIFGIIFIPTLIFTKK